MTNSTEYTPVLRQYRSLKEQYKECLLLYRLGDFYELFFEDAVIASKALDIVLTKRGADTPMCGVPYHSSDSYLGKLVKLGYKVAVCEQLETAEEARKRGIRSLVRREVVRIVTPGTLLEDGMLNAKDDNYLACIANIGDRYGIAWMELSTGLFNVRSTRIEDLDSEIQRLGPSELLISDKLKEQQSMELVLKRHRCAVTSHNESFFDAKRAEKVLCGIYGVSTVQGLGNFEEVEIAACGSLVEYVRMTQRGNLPKLSYPKVRDNSSFVLIDGPALRNLELFCTQSGDKKGSLISAIDRTVTTMGGRLLKRYLAFPAACHNVIKGRQDAVEFFVNHRSMCEMLRGVMGGIPDIERILTRIKLSRCSPKDVYMLGQALSKIYELSKIMSATTHSIVSRILVALGDHRALLKLISETIAEHGAVHCRDGGFINPSCNERLAELARIQDDSGSLIQRLRDKYRAQTGISSLKILCNNLLGYYIEVSSSYRVTDESFIRRQSMVNSTRYTTAELKELEERIISARSESVDLEAQIFKSLCTRIADEAQGIGLAAESVAELDVLTSLAEVAVESNYVRPIVDDSSKFRIVRGRHPVVEEGTDFIANDCDLSEGSRMCLVTGPNMAGKSTFLRQNALIAVLAHIGSFVPAEYAHIGVIDKIFSRVGASDNIAVGHSTFMVEMVETAAILNQATSRSLIILDEIGRGTGINDGLSIALATIEHIHDVTFSRAICATHYHELPKLSERFANMKFLCLRIEEWKGEVVFLHEVVPGISSKSYGIHVAGLAGFPKRALDRAKFFMSKFDAHDVSYNKCLDGLDTACNSVDDELLVEERE
ncbi:DNA mismatch repair protein MutS [Candidatus Anaplasma sp. TIGMIC]|uniref:DNA mismatch repair protein MutS n=1 Tax=Candidatus Anaplasma sp. TIGMIC TaxID=3020713 RepID=UPI0023303443|nr:DNA mismatch repair protein MutS [Candidatus Anaplasma sp. TIGMIC]MDB1135095.1 DNA mismatch repair protein MutS [Candidatus Anaplasma sp. TIGMIC]